MSASRKSAAWSRLSEEDWDRVLAVNLKSAFLTMKHVIPMMEVQGGGSIINISSIAAIRYTGVPYATYYASQGGAQPSDAHHGGRIREQARCA